MQQEAFVVYIPVPVVSLCLYYMYVHVCASVL